MKVTQIVAESTKKPVSEAPVSGLAQFGKKVLAKTAAKVGAKNFASGVAGNVDTGAEANNLRKSWQNHQGATGGSMKANDPVEFKNWLLQNGFKGKDTVIDAALKDSGAVAGGPFNKKVLDAALLKIVQGSKKASPQDAQAKQPPQVDANKDGKDDKSGKAMAPPKATDPAVAKDPAVATDPAGGEIPQGIQSQLDQLTPGEKKYLSDTLSQGGAPPKATSTGGSVAPTTPPKATSTGGSVAPTTPPAGAGA
tara:strand:+ start:652 stop:1407 length:756 start_codon:yes stop_codon:yes gene_type:complete